jgi:dTDP-4-dehydrorhamnose 3,5-epimerase-like enzyme
MESNDGRNSSFTVFKKKGLEGRLGDFSCSPSIRKSKCAFHVENLGEATQICKVYGEVCKAFVLTKEKEGLVIYLKHNVLRVEKNNHSALFVKTRFIPKLSGLRTLLLSDLTD